MDVTIRDPPTQGELRAVVDRMNELTTASGQAGFIERGSGLTEAYKVPATGSAGVHIGFTVMRPNVAVME